MFVPKTSHKAGVFSLICVFPQKVVEHKLKNRKLETAQDSGVSCDNPSLIRHSRQRGVVVVEGSKLCILSYPSCWPQTRILLYEENLESSREARANKSSSMVVFRSKNEFEQEQGREMFTVFEASLCAEVEFREGEWKIWGKNYRKGRQQEQQTFRKLFHSVNVIGKTATISSIVFF